jgi:hypothetical protein
MLCTLLYSGLPAAVTAWVGGGAGQVASDPGLEAGEEADVLQQALGAHSLARLVPTN